MSGIKRWYTLAKPEKRLRLYLRRMMGLFWQDVHFGLRSLQKSRSLALTAIISLGLAIGASTAIFDLIDSILLRQLPVREPKRLVELSLRVSGEKAAGFSFPMFREIGQRQQVCSGLFSWWGDAVLNVEVEGTYLQADTWAVSGNFFQELGVLPFAGRLLEDQDARLGAAPEQVAVVGYNFWQRHFDANPSAVGRIMHVEGIPFRIVGIAPKGFTGMSIAVEPEVTIPLPAQPLVTNGEVKGFDDRKWFGLEVGGRLKRGMTIREAQAEMESLWPQIQAATAPLDYSGFERSQFIAARLKVDSAARGIDLYIRDRYRFQLYTLLGVTLTVVIIACINLNCLMLARASTQMSNVGLRITLGANRWQIVRLLFVESLCLAVLAGGLGLVFASWASRALVSFMLQSFIVPPALDVVPRLRVFGFALLIATMTGVVLGLAPAKSSVSRGPADLLRYGSKITGLGARRFGKVIALQVTISFVLVMCAGLFTKSVANLKSVKSGFRRADVLAVRLTPIPGGYSHIEDKSYYPELVRRLNALPSVIAASIGSLQPGSSKPWKQMVAETRSDSTEAVQSSIAVVSPNFLNTLEIRLFEGRDFDWRDQQDSPRVAIVSRKLAEKLFSSRGGVIGRRIRIGAGIERQGVTVIGVVEDARVFDIREAGQLVLYLPLLQEPAHSHWGTALVKVSGSPSLSSNALAREIEALGHEYPLRTRTLAQVMDVAFLQERLMAFLSSFLACVALILASIGLYGLVSYSTTQRTSEVGIRTALGAQQRSLMRMMVFETLAFVFLGIAIGLPLSVAVGKLVSGLLFEVRAYDFSSLALAACLLLLVGAAAAYFPARRAASVDPMIALRHE